MKTIENSEDFNALMTQEKLVVLDFYADWCGPCQTLLPIVSQLSEEYKDRVAIRKVNVDEQQELAAKFQVRSIPALFFIKEAKIVAQFVGAKPKFELEERIDALLA